MKKAGLLLLILALSACGDGTYRDLEQFVKDTSQIKRGRVEPLPEVKPYEPVNYNAFALADPFKPSKIEPKAAASGAGGLQPDLARRKEALEAFSLENLKLVGSLEQNKVTYALIKAPDNSLHRVKTGNYLGQNFGQVTQISESEIKLKEIIQDSSGDWSERVSSLQLQEQ